MSVNAGVIFYYRLLTVPNDERQSKVKLFLGGQKCKKCRNVFEVSQGHDSKIVRAITKVLNKVKQKFYNLNAISSISTTENAYIPGNRAGPHKTTFCQLCEKGVCEYNKKITSIGSQRDWRILIKRLDDDYSTSDSG